jgi:predicted nucleotidyltransferase
VDILRVVSQEASLLGILYFVVGAAARDIVLEHCHAIRPARGTRDLDIAVEVAGWHEFEALSAALVATGKFDPTRELHRLKYGSHPIDIVPFGGVSTDGVSIAWPPDNQVLMNIMGFQEAYQYGLTVRLSEDPVFDVKVPSIPGMALMKIVSWKDSYPLRPKDAEDLLFLIDNYAAAGNEDRLFDEETELLSAEGFDLVLAGIRLLGRDMAAMANRNTAEMIQAILEEEGFEQERNRMVQHMATGSRNYQWEETQAKLEKLIQGFIERFQRVGA